jgi:hypothetical protein
MSVSIDASWDAKYPDTKEKFYTDWTADIPDGDTIVSVEAEATDGLLIENITQQVNITRLTISGGNPGSTTARVQLIALLASGDTIGRNVALPVLRR